MEYSFDVMSEETFFSEELVAVIHRQMGYPSRPEINYNDLQPRLQKLCEYITPVMTGIKIIGPPNCYLVEPKFNYIKNCFAQVPIEQRPDAIFDALINVAKTMLSDDEQEQRFFVFMSFICIVCIWLHRIAHTESIPKIPLAVRSVLTTIFPGGFISTLEGLKDYVNA